jgi:hypothetical protein
MALVAGPLFRQTLLDIQLEPDAALAVTNHAPTAREGVEEREPAARLALRARHHDVVGDEAATAVTHLDPNAGVADVDDETHASLLAPHAVLDGVREQLADEQPDGEANLGMRVERLQPVDGRARLTDRALRGRQVELEPPIVDSGRHAAVIPIGQLLYRRRVDAVDARKRQLAENEVRFRALNERLRNASGTWNPGEGALELVCECGDENCASAIQLTPRDYEAVRSDEAQFMVRPGHERPEVEDVVAEREGWIMVRKRGDAAEIAGAADPRG